nr:ATP synthase subunit-like protein [Ipomoea batatas]
MWGKTAAEGLQFKPYLRAAYEGHLGTRREEGCNEKSLLIFGISRWECGLGGVLCIAMVLGIVSVLLALCKDKDTNEWPNDVEVWKASRTKSNGTWSVPNGEEIMNKLQEEGEKNKEKISTAPLPLVEHFSLVLKRKSSYAHGLGLEGITSKAQEKILLQAEIEASKKREKNLEEEVAKFKEIAQAAFNKQAAEIKQIFAHLASNQGLQNMLSNASPSTTSSED